MVEPEKKDCGIVMPISAMESYPANHWAEVLDILEVSIEDAGFVPRLVSEADATGVIHKSIVHNLYQNSMIVCDVSGKNPNVMFELGMRLAFDKPAIIIKDDATPYSFDTAGIEHLQYPKDLRFPQMVEFKERLSEKILATEKASLDSSYTTFLKHFGEFKVATLEEKEVSAQQYILDELKNLRVAFERTSSVGSLGPRTPKRASPSLRDGRLNACMRGVPSDQIEEALALAQAVKGFKDARITGRADDHKHLLVSGTDNEALAALKDVLYSRFPH